MTHKEFILRTIDEVAGIHKPDYIAELRLMVSEASERALVVCCAWHSQFGRPGFGSAGWVKAEIAKAEKAVEAMTSYRRGLAAR